jgi:hypothetical protein
MDDKNGISVLEGFYLDRDYNLFLIHKVRDENHADAENYQERFSVNKDFLMQCTREYLTHQPCIFTPGGYLGLPRTIEANANWLERCFVNYKERKNYRSEEPKDPGFTDLDRNKIIPGIYKNCLGFLMFFDGAEFAHPRLLFAYDTIPFEEEMESLPKMLILATDKSFDKKALRLLDRLRKEKDWAGQKIHGELSRGYRHLEAWDEPLYD